MKRYRLIDNSKMPQQKVGDLFEWDEEESMLFTGNEEGKLVMITEKCAIMIGKDSTYFVPVEEIEEMFEEVK